MKSKRTSPLGAGSLPGTGTHAGPRATARRLWQQPLLHFLLLGSLLFFVSALWRDWAQRLVDYPEPQRIEQLQRDWLAQHGGKLEAAQREALIRQEIDERILFAEALRLRLHLGDPVVLRRLHQDLEFLGIRTPPGEEIRTALDMQLYHGDELIRRRLVERMRSIGSGPLPEPTESALRERMQAQRERWMSAPRISFEQCFLRHESGVAERAAALLKSLRQNPAGPLPQGDPFLHGELFQRLDEAQLSKRFGAAFSRQLLAETRHRGDIIGPLASPYGLHLLRVVDHDPPRPLPFEHVRPQLLREWQQDMAQAHLRQWMAALRLRYRVRR